jgi:hypothetical protein
VGGDPRDFLVPALAKLASAWTTVELGSAGMAGVETIPYLPVRMHGEQDEGRPLFIDLYLSICLVCHRFRAKGKATAVGGASHKKRMST